MEYKVNDRVHLDNILFGTIEKIENNDLFIRWDDDKDRLVRTPISHFVEVGMQILT
jgi:hypothetical protein